jgi:hypothetical protein
MRLPYNELLDLKLNDRIVIRDKRYVINQYTTDLTTFESDFELIQDFRTINFDNSGLRQVSSEAQTLTFFTTSKEPLTWTIQSDPEGLIEEVKNEPTYVQVDLYENTTGEVQIITLQSNLNDTLIIEIDA